MASIPANGQHSIIAERVELNVTDSATNAAGDQFEQLYSCTFRGEHKEGGTPFGDDEHWSYATGSMMFDFSCWSSPALLTRLRTAYNFLNGALPLRFYHVKYYTVAGGTTAKWVNFSGRIKSLSWSLQGGPETLMPVACSVRIQGANFTTAGGLPSFESTAHNLPADGLAT